MNKETENINKEQLANPMFYRDKSFIVIITLFFLGLNIFFLLDYSISTNLLIEENLKALSEIAAPIGVIFSGIAIYLLFKNYRLQKEELNKLTTANERLVEGGFRSNDLQFVLYEKKLLSDEFNNLVTLKGGILNMNNLIDHLQKNLVELINMEENKSNEESIIQKTSNIIILIHGDNYEIVNYIFRLNKKLGYLKMILFFDESLNGLVSSFNDNLIKLLHILTSKHLKNILYRNKYGDIMKKNPNESYRKIYDQLKEFVQDTTELQLMIKGY